MYLYINRKNSSKHCLPPQRRAIIAPPTTAATIRNKRRKEKQETEVGRIRNIEKTET